MPPGQLRSKLRFYVEIAGSRVTKAHRAQMSGASGASGESGTRGCACPSVNHYKWRGTTPVASSGVWPARDYSSSK